MNRPTGPARSAICRAVVVDDHRDSADMLAELLALRGLEVRTAYDGHDALGMIERERPELLLVDLGLPGLDGYELARRVRAANPGSPMRIVAVTGWADPASRERALAAGFDEHVLKPVDIGEVIRLADESCAV